MIAFIVLCFVCASLAAENSPSDPTYGGIFNENYNDKNKVPNKFPGEYIHIDDKQDGFDWLLTKQLLHKQSKNVILSPLSVKTLMTLIAEAAGKDVASLTRTQLEAVLPHNNKTLDNAKEYFHKVLSSIKSPSKEYKVNFASRIYVDKDVSLNQKFTATAEHDYWARSQNLNFNDGRSAAEAINKFVRNATENHITDLVSEDSVTNSVILLINALYFNGKWQYAFNKTSTKPFQSSSGKTQKTFMEHTRNFYYFNSAKLGAKILRLPYAGDKFSMFIILPKEGKSLDSVIESFDHKVLSDEIKNLEELEVHVALPRFRFDSSNNLNQAIQALGITEIFENTATLPLLARGGASEGKLKVSNIIQKSGIIVNEIGTEAWAATEVEIVNKFGGDPREFVVDRPFMFFIEDETTGAKLFTGRVENPE